MARALHGIRVRRSLLGQCSSRRSWLEGHVYGPAEVLVIGTDGRLQRDVGAPVPLGYDDTRGVYSWGLQCSDKEESEDSHELDWPSWIPVALPNAQPGLMCLRELFEHAAEIRDLAVAPPQRVAVMRLLMCIAHAALDGPADEAEWRRCRSRIAPACLGYLQKWLCSFDLFGSSAFLQPREAEADEQRLRRQARLRPGGRQQPRAV